MVASALLPTMLYAILSTISYEPGPRVRAGFLHPRGPRGMRGSGDI